MRPVVLNVTRGQSIVVTPALRPMASLSQSQGPPLRLLTQLSYLPGPVGP